MSGASWLLPIGMTESSVLCARRGLPCHSRTVSRQSRVFSRHSEVQRSAHVPTFDNIGTGVAYISARTIGSPKRTRPQR